MIAPYIDLPPWTMRALHSEFIGWCVHVEPMIREAMFERMGGVSFERFCLAMIDGRFKATVRTVDDEVHVGMCVPAETTPWVLFEIPARKAGLDIDRFITSVSLDLDTELAELLGGHE